MAETTIKNIEYVKPDNKLKLRGGTIKHETYHSFMFQLGNLLVAINYRKRASTSNKSEKLFGVFVLR